MPKGKLKKVQKEEQEKGGRKGESRQEGNTNQGQNEKQDQVDQAIVGRDECYMDKFTRFIDYIVYEIPPGPPLIPQYVYINIHKGGVFAVILGMMLYYKNFSLGAWVYLLMHGTYGFFWLLKDFVFPDKCFQRKVTLISFIYPFPLILFPYYYSAWVICRGEGDQNPSPEKLFVCVGLYITGLILMLGSDAQKYYMLRERPGLISDGYFKYTRNPNYLGEMMLYTPFALMAQSCIVWFILFYMWSIVFTIRMLIKDHSLSKKKGWNQYSQHSWILFPKINGSFFTSLIFYSLLIFSVYNIYQNGGIQQTSLKVANPFDHIWYRFFSFMICCSMMSLPLWIPIALAQFPFVCSFNIILLIVIWLTPLGYFIKGQMIKIQTIKNAFCGRCFTILLSVFLRSKMRKLWIFSYLAIKSN